MTVGLCKDDICIAGAVANNDNFVCVVHHVDIVNDVSNKNVLSVTLRHVTQSKMHDKADAGKHQDFSDPEIPEV